MSTGHRPAWVELDGTHNVRDLGGLRAVDGRRVRPGVLLRGDHLEDLTPAAAALLRARTGLRLVVDLRSPSEHPRVGRWAEGLDGEVEHLGLPMVDLTRATDAVGELTGEARIVAFYRLMLDAAAPSLATLLQRVATEHTPALVHCAAGKDRTGIAVAVLLRAGGVRDVDILADYAATGERLPRIRTALAARPGGHYRTPVEPADGTPLATAPLRAVLDALDEAGGTARYLHRHGVRAETVDRWQELLLV